MAYRDDGGAEFCTVCGVTIVLGARRQHEAANRARHPLILISDRSAVMESSPGDYTRGYRQGILDLWEMTKTNPVLAAQTVEACAKLVHARDEDRAMLSEWQRAHLV